MISYLVDEIIDFFFFWLIKRKKKKAEWLGVLEDKRKKDDFTLSRQKYQLIFRREDGKKIKFNVDEDDFSSYEKGKRYLKKSGEFLPDPASGVETPGSRFY